MKIAIDWSHTKDLTTCDGKKVRVENRKALLARLKKLGDGNMGGESRGEVQSMSLLHPPVAIIEQGCPLSILYNLLLTGVEVKTISNRATEDYRKEHDIVKTDEADARIMWELSENGAKLTDVTLDDKLIQMKDAYHQYCRYQKARVAMMNMRKAHQRHYRGAGESIVILQSKLTNHLAPDLSPYDIAIDTLKAREKSLIKKVEQIGRSLALFEVGGESTQCLKSKYDVQPPIKGLGQRIWAGIIVTANPSTFKCLSAYLRFCGLTGDVIESHKYNRHAKMLYHMLAEEVMKQRDPTFRPIYDKCKADIAEKHPDYKKIHIHNAALNRTATFLAKAIFNYIRGKTGDESNTRVESMPWLQSPVVG